MAGKTLIGGTPYTVTGGKTLIGGTEYSIARGKTLIGGTEQTIEFSNVPTIRELFGNMTHVATNARSSDTTGYVSFAAVDGYYLVFYKGIMSLVKVSGSTISTLFSTVSSDIPTLVWKDDTKLCISKNGQTTTAAKKQYGSCAMQVIFGDYSEDDVVACLENATVTASAGTDSSTSAAPAISSSYLTSTSVVITEVGSKVRVAVGNSSEESGVDTIFTNGEAPERVVRVSSSNIWLYYYSSLLSRWIIDGSCGNTQIAME